MKLIAKHVKNVVVIDLFGEININSSPRLKKSIDMVIDHGIYQIILNLKPTQYVDSVGMGTLVGIQKKLKTLEGEICFVGVRPEILKAFELVRLKKLFRHFDAKKEALDYFEGGDSTKDSNIDDILAEAKDILGMNT